MYCEAQTNNTEVTHVQKPGQHLFYWKIRNIYIRTYIHFLPGEKQAKQKEESPFR